jgi:hypothetical protein
MLEHFNVVVYQNVIDYHIKLDKCIEPKAFLTKC